MKRSANPNSSNASSKTRHTTVARMGAAQTIPTPTAAARVASMQTAETSGENDCSHANNVYANSRGTSSKAQPKTRGSLGKHHRKRQQRSEERAVQSREQAEVIALELRVRHGELLV